MESSKTGNQKSWYSLAVQNYVVIKCFQFLCQVWLKEECDTPQRFKHKVSHHVPHGDY